HGSCWRCRSARSTGGASGCRTRKILLQRRQSSMPVGGICGRCRNPGTALAPSPKPMTRPCFGAQMIQNLDGADLSSAGKRRERLVDCLSLEQSFANEHPVKKELAYEAAMPVDHQLE